MAGKNLLRKATPSLDSQAGCAGLSPGERDLNGEKATRSGNEQGPAATSERGTRNGVAPYSPAAVVFRRGAGSAGHGATGRRLRNGGSKPAVDVASWDGNPLPEGPGRDGAAGSVRSMTARPDARSESGSVRNGNVFLFCTAQRCTRLNSGKQKR